MSEVARALLTVAFGALAGGITNTLAIWMIFHPYRPPRIGRWRLEFLQGAVPKNQPRLAAAIGRTVGGKLLTEEDLTRTFRQPEFRRAFDERLADFLSAVLHEERGPLRDLLPDSVFSEIEGIVDEAVDRGSSDSRTSSTPGTSTPSSGVGPEASSEPWRTSRSPEF